MNGAPDVAFHSCEEGFYLGSVSCMKSMRQCFQSLATVWLPWPRVASEMGMRMNLVLGILGRTRGLMICSPSSGGLMKSSAELIQRAGATRVESLGSGL